jgi:Tfp pilus assembly protein PilO
MKPFKVTLQARHKAVLGITGGLVMLVWAIRFLYSPLSFRIAERKTILHDLQVKLADARALAEQLPQEEEALRAVQARDEAMERRLGEGQSVARILEALGAEVKARRLELITLQAKEEGAEPVMVVVDPSLTLRAIPLSLKLSGRYQQIGAFLSGLSDAPFLASVQRLTMRRSAADNPLLRADVELIVYLSQAAKAL